MKNVSIIRSRGQLTIPDQVRKQLPWASHLSAVTISVVKPDEIVIRPHQVNVDWRKIKQNIKRSRAISGSGGQSAREFLAQDRQR